MAAIRNRFRTANKTAKTAPNIARPAVTPVSPRPKPWSRRKRALKASICRNGSLDGRTCSARPPGTGKTPAAREMVAARSYGVTTPGRSATPWSSSPGLPRTPIRTGVRAPTPTTIVEAGFSEKNPSASAARAAMTTSTRGAKYGCCFKGDFRMFARRVARVPLAVGTTLVCTTTPCDSNESRSLPGAPPSGPGVPVSPSGAANPTWSRKPVEARESGKTPRPKALGWAVRNRLASASGSPRTRTFAAGGGATIIGCETVAREGETARKHAVRHAARTPNRRTQELYGRARVEPFRPARSLAPPAASLRSPAG